ncbi:MobC family plasmid mobilization relaxosome protein [Pedobacter jeongneungensis]|uniref:MobC family plasmid mobilization relaxosome protein n=1 Tax=Pedobacter jeongneungensis TaxID=947309 RepID=UPI0004689489|nr:MobC family plasmid mobilization relaxosome protein [Pedobacter jeongneungensis]
MALPKGRSRIDDNDRDQKAKDFRFYVRVTKEEQNKILADMADLGIKRFSSYARIKLLNDKKAFKTLTTHDKLLYHLNKIGNNLNQIAKQMNQHGAYKMQAEEVNNVIELTKVLALTLKK